MNRRGNITLEAAIALPSFILFMMTFVLIFNTLTVHKAMQEALSDSALCLSAYAYLGFETGVLGIEKEASQAVEGKAASAKEKISSVMAFYKLMQGADPLIASEQLDPLLTTFEDAAQSAAEIIKDPKTFGISVLYAISQLVYERGKTAVLSPMANVMVRKYMENYHGYSLKAVESIWIEGNMDYMSSKFLGATPEIELIVHYSVRPLFFDGILPDLKLTNSIMVRCWGPGDEKSTLKKVTTSGWITPNGIKNGSVFHTMKCASLNSNNSSGNIPVQVEQYVGEGGQIVYKSVEYKGRVYTLCQNCANGGKIIR